MIVRNRQRRLNGVDEVVLLLYAQGLTARGDLDALLEDVELAFGLNECLRRRKVLGDREVHLRSLTRWSYGRGRKRLRGDHG